MAITRSADIADTVATVISEARHTEQFSEVIAPNVWRINKPLHSGETTNLPYWGTVTAGGLIDGEDMVNPQTMVDTNVRFTPAEVGAQILLTDKTVRDNNEDVLRAAGRILGDAMVAKREQDLAGQFGDGTNSVAGTGTAATLGQIAAARAFLKGNALSAGGPANGPVAAFQHPYVMLDLIDIFTPTIAGGTTPLAAAGMGAAERALNTGMVGSILGVNLFETGNITIDATPDSQGAFIKAGNGGGLVLVTADEWDVEPERDASLRATELNIVGEYAVGEYLAGWMVGWLCDATDPA